MAKFTPFSSSSILATNTNVKKMAYQFISMFEAEFLHKQLFYYRCILTYCSFIDIAKFLDKIVFRSIIGGNEIKIYLSFVFSR